MIWGLLIDIRGLLIDIRGLLIDIRGLLIYIWGLLIDIWGLLIDNSIERIRDLLIKQIWNKLVGCFLKFIES